MAASHYEIDGESALILIKFKSNVPLRVEIIKIAADKFFHFLVEDKDGVFHLIQNHHILVSHFNLDRKSIAEFIKNYFFFLKNALCSIEKET